MNHFLYLCNSNWSIYFQIAAMVFLYIRSSLNTELLIFAQKTTIFSTLYVKFSQFTKAKKIVVAEKY